MSKARAAHEASFPRRASRHERRLARLRERGVKVKESMTIPDLVRNCRAAMSSFAPRQPFPPSHRVLSKSAPCSKSPPRASPIHRSWPLLLQQRPSYGGADGPPGSIRTDSGVSTQVADPLPFVVRRHARAAMDVSIIALALLTYPCRQDGAAAHDPIEIRLGQVVEGELSPQDPTYTSPALA